MHLLILSITLTFVAGVMNVFLFGLHYPLITRMDGGACID